MSVSAAAHGFFEPRSSRIFVLPALLSATLRQSPSNLNIYNAIKYSPDGGAVEVELQEEQASCSAILSVRDHGMGIPSYQQGAIFSRFVRADNARDSNIGGTGLDLSLCRELIERHNGRIWFEPVENKGSTFYVSLPLAVAAESASDVV
jgi:signal transduction histidine kinase